MEASEACLPESQSSLCFAKFAAETATRIWYAVCTAPRSVDTSSQLRRGCGMSIPTGLDLYSQRKLVSASGVVAAKLKEATRRNTILAQYPKKLVKGMGTSSG